MKIIDEKGRLFGKINILDFLIIVLILVIIPGFFSIYKILGKTPVRIPHEWITVEAVTFTISEIAELIEAGDMSVDGFGNPDGKLVKVLKKGKEYGEKIKSAMIGTSRAKYETRIPVFLRVELLCTKSAKNEPWYYRRNHLLVSLEREEEFAFNTKKYRLVCHALKIKEIKK